MGCVGVAVLVGARIRLGACLAVGFAVAGVMAWAIASRGVSVSARGHVLEYGLAVRAEWRLVAGYLVATLGAPLLSGDRFLRVFGVVAFSGAVGCGVPGVYAGS